MAISRRMAQAPRGWPVALLLFSNYEKRVCKRKKSPLRALAGIWHLTTTLWMLPLHLQFLWSPSAGRGTGQSQKRWEQNHGGESVSTQVWPLLHCCGLTALLAKKQIPGMFCQAVSERLKANAQRNKVSLAWT